ncbi:hypothetical protein MFFC18_06270 [Mariniblastus fucicola]|uniref:Membrane protein (DUF2306) n=2 Tax=Mariniblastus fucicola TaxID=980251 RepID=A0A5B9P835_9BACT|nr:hypothetical protein MFFC18_06270 [Mariniblastus fucicola]
MKRIAFWLLVMLFVKVLGSIVFEYRNYFPANFESNFLVGREAFFSGSYRVAFYTHILCGPISLLVAAFLIFSGSRKALSHWHRRLGKLLASLVLLVLLPSGLVMATRALTGPVAGAAFFVQTFATALCVGFASWYASRRRFNQHRAWATRTFILLCSPLLLRLITGATVAFELESSWTYRFAAWGSWLIPLAVYECRNSILRRSIARSIKGTLS